MSKQHARVRSLASVLALGGALLAFTLPAHGGDRILFIRGGERTGGFLEGGADEQLSDINDYSTAAGNHGFGELHDLLLAEGYAVDQVIEGPAENNTKIDFSSIDLASYQIIVFGSNNADYDANDAALIGEWVCRGGAALFISDANWGRSWCDAPNSDQTFLGQFDLIMNQDAFLYTLRRADGDFVVGGDDRGMHPILAGPDGQLGTPDDVNSFDGEGVSPLTLTSLLPGVEPMVLAKAEIGIHVNDQCDSDGGSVRGVTLDDGALVALEYGGGRVAGHFDRNTFFNQNGAGTSLHREDNAQYAKNLFRWLADAPGLVFGSACPGSGGASPALDVSPCPRRGRTVTLGLTHARPLALACLVVGIGRADVPLPNGCSWHVLSPVILFPTRIDTNGTWSLTTTIPSDAPVVRLTSQFFVADPGAPGGFAASNGLELPIF
jgi:hypothetical protein